MLRCSDHNCESKDFQRIQYGYTNFSEEVFLDEKGTIIDWGERDDGDTDINDEGTIKCSRCGRIAEHYDKVSKKKKVKIDWKGKIND